MRNKKKRIMKSVICFLVIFSFLIPTELPVYATQNRTGNYSRSFTLSGNGADDIVSVARAQIGKTGSQLGYSEEWCADFVSDCAALANQGNVIPGNGYCPTLQSNIINAGGREVSISSAQKGDIAFYGPNGANHVEIVYANTNGRISTIGGNSGSGSNCYSRSVRDHSSQSMTITKVLRPNYGQTPAMLPGTVDASWNVPANVTASYRITTYDQWGNAESNHYIDPGDNCYVSEVYTNGFVKVQYPTPSGNRWAYAKRTDFSLSKKQENNPALPGTIDGSWNVPANVTASHRITTYDQWGNAESNHYIDPGDNCYIPEVYTNGFVKVKYPTPGGDRWAYAKASDFDLKQVDKLPNTVLKTWFSKDPMGNELTTARFNDTIYLCYRLETEDGKLLDPSIGNYTVRETFYLPDGSAPSFSYDRSNNNWIRTTFNQWGNYRGVVEISGDYTGQVEVSHTMSKESCTHNFGSWATTKKATCTENGTEQRKCSFCGKTETRELKASGHKYTTKTVQPTYTQKGYTLHTCLNCGYSYKDNDTEIKKKQLTSINIATLPFTTVYFRNDRLDTTGMKVIAVYSDGSKKEVANWNASVNLGNVGHTQVKVTYSEGGKTATATFTVRVDERPKKTVTITYYSCGGSWVQKKQEVKQNEKTKLISGQPDKNYIVTLNPNGGTLLRKTKAVSAPFLGWYTSKGASGIRYTPGQEVSFSANTSLYAAYGEAKIGDIPAPVRNGYSFAGWCLPNGQEATADTLISDRCTLTARWDVAESSLNPEENQAGTDNTGDEEEDREDPIAVGDEIAMDEAIFTVTELGSSPCVEYTELFDDDVKDVVIPATITEDGVTYKVTSVASKAFYKNTGIQSVTIGANITKIGSKAFYGGKSLKKIVIVSNDIQSGSIGSKAFAKVSKNVKAYVPGAKYSAYKKMLKKAGIGSKAKIYKV